MRGDVTLYAPIAKVDAERREVFGYASTPTRDQQGEVITKEAVAAALPDYLTYPALREMHQPSAVGKGIEAQVDGKGLWFGAKVVDDRAWNKVLQGVYRGFSIGGRVTQRDPDDRSVVKGIELVEVSLVDRPCNPDASFQLVKREPGGDGFRFAPGVRKIAAPWDVAHEVETIGRLLPGGLRPQFGAGWSGDSPFIGRGDIRRFGALTVLKDGRWTDRATGMSGTGQVLIDLLTRARVQAGVAVPDLLAKAVGEPQQHQQAERQAAQVYANVCRGMSLKKAKSEAKRAGWARY